MSVPFVAESQVEYGEVSLLPNGLQALAILSPKVSRNGVEHSVVAAASRNIRIYHNLLAVPPAHFFPASSLPSTAPRYSLSEPRSTSPKSSGQSPTRPS